MSVERYVASCNDFAVADSTSGRRVDSPAVAGFVCAPGSSADWVSHVRDMWRYYYVFGSGGSNFDAFDADKVRNVGEVVDSACAAGEVTGDTIERLCELRRRRALGCFDACGHCIGRLCCKADRAGVCCQRNDRHSVNACRADDCCSSSVGNSATSRDVGVEHVGNARDGLVSKESVGDTVVVERESVSEKTLANREKRVKKKERKLRKQRGGDSRKFDSVPEWRRTAGPLGGVYRGAFETCDDETRKELAATRARRLIAENNACVRKAQVESDRWAETVKLQKKKDNLQMLKVGKQIEALRSDGVESIREDLEQRRLSQQLKIAQSRQKLELIAAQDVEGLKRRQASKVLRDTETNKVAVERAFGTLAGTGNIPSLVGGKVYTVNSGSISPNSSASEAEVRAIQKRNLDLEKQVEELTARLEKSGTDMGGKQGYGEYEYSEGITIDEDGSPIGDFGDAYSGYIGKDNRFHFGESMMPYFD